MKRRRFIEVIAGGLLAAPLAAEAQPAGKVWRVGLLTTGFKDVPGSNPGIVPLTQGLRDLGYVDGRNLALEIRYAEGRTDRFPVLAAELVSLKVDVLIAVSTPGALAAKQATSTTPIVMAAVGEPVEVKLVESLAHPGGNVTGLSLIAPELAAKRLDLLKQALPKLSRVTVLWSSANQGMQASSRRRSTEHSLSALHSSPRPCRALKISSRCSRRWRETGLSPCWSWPTLSP
jgi:putative tryptophan/tyrosine transport system substrate-binding protein